MKTRQIQTSFGPIQLIINDDLPNNTVAFIGYKNWAAWINGTVIWQDAKTGKVKEKKDE